MTAIIAWKDGMALSQQHLQKSDRLFLRHIKSVSGLPSGIHFGFRKLSLDEDLFKAGNVAFAQCEAVFPSGLFYGDGEYANAKIESRNYEEAFSRDLNFLDVFLTLELNGSIECAETEETRYKVIWENFADVNTGDDLIKMPISIPIPKIAFGGENLDGKEFVHCARIIRNGQGCPELDRNFYPPLISVLGSDNFFRELNFIESIVKSKKELSAFWAVLAVLKNTEGILPIQIFCEICRLLQTPYDYNHFDFNASFNKIFKEMRSFLNKEQREVFSQMRLLRDGQCSFFASVAALNIKNAKNIYLAINCELSTEDAVRAIPMSIKIASKSKLSKIVISAVNGISCSQTIAPSGFKANENLFYVKLVMEGVLWNELCEENEIGIYAPSVLKINAVDILVENLSNTGS